MEALYSEKNLLYKILYDNECFLLKEGEKEVKNKTLDSPGSVILK